ncbi:MAG: 2-oxo acid dehydrogenase subunit [Aeromicrobium sp.]|nr:2-oxo acid dehydrogenase subunit [Aeromicrobium sp.]
MSNVKQFALPDVGEGLTQAEIVSWSVQVGDIIEINQTLVEIETAKSLVELPSPFAGTVTELHAREGETVDVGLPIISVATGEAPSSEVAVEEYPQGSAEKEPKLLVGYGPREGSSRRRHRPVASSLDPQPIRPITGPVRAKPPVRKLAKTLGIDLKSLSPTGPYGTVSRADVTAAAGGQSTVATAVRVAEVRRSGAEDIRIPIKGVRKHTAAAMVSSAFTAPHVTEFITVDISRTMELRQSVLTRRDFQGVKVSPLTFVASAFLKAMVRTPQANSRWDEAAQEIVQMYDINLGIAAATPRGLVVPNIKAAQELSLCDLAASISDLAATARSGKTSPTDMAGGTTTITNIGVFGIDAGTPILNPGETAILAFGTVRRMPWVVTDEAGERIEPRWVTQLALSFDHRVMDGQQGSELLSDTANILQNPGLALL